MKFNNQVRSTIRGLMMSCFMLNIFMFLMVMEAWGAGLVPDHLPVLLIGSAVLCLIGYHGNKDREDEDADS